MGGIFLIPGARKDNATKRIPAIPLIFKGKSKNFNLILLSFDFVDLKPLLSG